MAHLAAANAMHRKTRTAISVLAVGVEVATLMLLVGLANGTLNDIAARLQNVGADVLVQPPDASLILGATTATLPVKLVDLIKRMDGVREVTPVLNWHVSRIRDESKVLNLWAVDYPSFQAIAGGLEIVTGRPLAERDDLLVDTLLAQTTGLKVGDVVPLITREFHVVGIFRAGAGGRIYARLTDIQDAIGTPGKASFFLVKGRAAAEADTLAKALQARFKGYRITPIAQVSQAIQDNAVGLREFQQAVTAMAVAVSFLVVLLAMYTAIVERTREIGILRAIGASQAQVVRLVMSESALLCSAGVVLGMLLAVLGRALMLHAFPTQVIELSPQWSLLAGAMGLLGGMLGSVYPALKAARMDPVQALNFE